MGTLRVPLRVGVKPEDGEIVEIGQYRHKVIWAGETRPSVIDYCNNCGGAFVFGPVDGPDYCNCGAPADDVAYEAMK